MPPVDWHALLVPSESLIELVLRGSIMYLLILCAFRFRWAHRVIHGEPLPLVVGGRIQWKNLRREFLTRDDLLEQLRQHQVDDVAQVKRCLLEADGHLSVQKFEPGDDAGGTGKRKRRVG